MKSFGGASIGVGLMALALHGCGESYDADRTDSLLNGETTLDRPEIGLISVGGIRCTATLITPSVLVSASHCLGYRTALSPGSYGRFTIYLPTGETSVYEVDRYRSFSSSLGWEDVSLLHLRTPVPSSVAQPLTLGATRPPAGESLTIYGYGCTVRGTQIGFGTKRRRTFAEGQSVNMLCPGDSGGPVLRSATAEVLRVNSSYGSRDGFGDVTRVYDRLIAQLTAWGETTTPPVPPTPPTPPTPPPPPPPPPTPPTPPPPREMGCGMYAGWNLRNCISDTEWVRCTGDRLERETCPSGGRCVRRPNGFDDVCVPPAGAGEACGANSWIDVFTCNQSRTQRVLCVDGTLLREPCARGCVTRPNGVDDVCAP